MRGRASVIVRTHADGSIAVGQALHAHLAARIARAWGSEPHYVPAPVDELYLALESHEAGMAHSDSDPCLDPLTGLPYDYQALPQPVHVTLWHRVARSLVPQSRYAALLVSRHATWIFAQYEPKPAADYRKEMAAFLLEERALQLSLQRSLGQDPQYEHAVRPEALARTSTLFQTWDRISAHLCRGTRPPTPWTAAPTRSGLSNLALQRTGPECWTLSPWPLRVPELRLRGEGRLLPERFVDQRAFSGAWDDLPWRAWEMTLSPGIPLPDAAEPAMHAPILRVPHAQSASPA